MSAPKMIVLKSSDDETFEIEESVALQSQTIKNMIETDCDVNTIPLPNVTSQILAKIIEYCKRHDDASNKSSSEGIITNKSAEDDLKAFDAEFLKVDQDTLFDLILAANYLDIKGLLNLTCENVANMMKGKTPDEIRETFHIKNDYTPEEEEEIRRENSWAFE